jgi:DNA-binding transcriptional LysR family regulator
LRRHRATAAINERDAQRPHLLRGFVTVAEDFGRAADRLYIAEPALSRSIQRLERVVGRRLFVRTTRSVELTPTARVLLPAVRDGRLDVAADASLLRLDPLIALRTRSPAGGVEHAGG